MSLPLLGLLALIPLAGAGLTVALVRAVFGPGWAS